MSGLTPSTHPETVLRNRAKNLNLKLIYDPDNAALQKELNEVEQQINQLVNKR